MLKRTLLFILFSAALFWGAGGMTADRRTAPQRASAGVGNLDAGLPSQDSSLGSPASESVPVVRVIDGDTIVVQMGGRDEIVRLIGINSPETVDPRKKVECFGREASDHMKELVLSAFLRVEADPTQGVRDRYGRLLAYIIRDDGLNINKAMIEGGYAYEYTYKKPYKFQTQFKMAEKSARENGRGLWAPRCV